MPSRSATTKAVGAVAAALASGLYLDNRYGVSKDISQLLYDKQWVKTMNKRIADMGDHVTIYRMLELADPDASALWFEGRSWTYAELKIDIDKFAAILESRNVGVGDVVAVFMANAPEMIIAYYALSKLGAVPALINNSLRSQTLEHCMQVASAKLIICTPDLIPAVLGLYSETAERSPCISFNLLSFPPLVLDSSHEHNDRISQIRYDDLAAVTPIATILPKRSLADTGCLIYTSGTTGKPKAVNIKHAVLIAVSNPLSEDTSDKRRYYPLRTYSCLPLFHGTCLFTGVFYCVGQSGTFCLGRKFSASKFTQELVASRATRMLYVGELCRYLLRAPESKADKAHSVIVAHGNGMSRDVWERFRKRFNIPEVREFYRSTEGKAKFDNFSRSSAAAGFVGFSGLIRTYLEEETYLVKYDPSTEAPYRDPKTGFCVPVEAGESGEAIGRVRSMEFYSEYLNNPAANDSKLIRDVFAKGDLFQRTGDLLMRNSRGWIGFQDRTGDTYRWRGENVSAGEVREHIAKLEGVTDIAVFAVRLDGYDGQAGAAGISLHDSDEEARTTFMNRFYPSLKASGLTIYQIPRLVRITEQLETGATFKHAKEVMKARPWDPELNVQSNTKDSLYWLNGEQYEELTPAQWQEIKAARARL